MGLFARARRADPEAFDALYRAEVDWVVRSFRRLGAREADLEDLAHELFVVVHRQLPTFERGRPVRPWLFGIAVRVVAAYRRRASFRRERSVAEAPVWAHSEERAGPEAVAADGQLRDELMSALADLPLEQSAVFVAVVIDETPVPEVAQALSIPLNTCYSRLRLARQHLATALAPRASEGGRR